MVRGSRRASNTEAGFSLIELLVVTAIFVILTGIILSNNSRFGGVVVLENMAYDLALSVRHAQLYGIAVRRFGATDFNVGYGINFNCNGQTPCAATSYVLFADSLTGNGIYDPPSELIETTTIVGGHRVSNLCVRNGGSETCGGLTGYTCSKSRLDILFKRPEPDAYILSFTGGNPDGVYQEAACIVLTSPRGQSKAVTVERTGQIAVQ
jgi:prepilin-type N-terminal cleavage/methylation domain-containing protein